MAEVNSQKVSIKESDNQSVLEDNKADLKGETVFMATMNEMELQENRLADTFASNKELNGFENELKIALSNVQNLKKNLVYQKIQVEQDTKNLLGKIIIAEKEIIDLRHQVEILKITKMQLESKEEKCCILETKINNLRKEFDNFIDLLNKQRSDEDKSGLGYMSNSSDSLDINVKAKNGKSSQASYKNSLSKTTVQNKVKLIWRPKRRNLEHEGIFSQTKLLAKVENTWILDSGCSHHMTGDKIIFTKLEFGDFGLVWFGNDDYIKLMEKGIVVFGNNIFLIDVYYATGLKHNLLSVTQICDQDFYILFDDYGYEIKMKSREIFIVGSRTQGNIYEVTSVKVLDQLRRSLYDLPPISFH